MHYSFPNFLKTHGTREKVINENKVNVRDVMKSNEDKRMSQNQTSITGYLTAESSKKQHNAARPQAPQCKESHNLKLKKISLFILQMIIFFPKPRVEIDCDRAKRTGSNNFHGFIMAKSKPFYFH